jgi:S1-C subfamily serine protease
MTARIIITHAAGSKANQVEQFPVDGTREITFGRDPGSVVAFDPVRDDAASRHHAVLKVTGGERPGFVLQDLGSANGTFVNGRKLTGEQDLLPGDTVEFGRNGPRIIFDVQPRPAHLMARTRVVPTGMVAASDTAATRIVDTASAQAAPPPTAKVGVGKETVARMLHEERRAISRTWIYLLAGVLVVAGGGAAYMKWSSDKAARQQEQARAAENAARAAETAALAASLRREERERTTKMGLTAEDIAHKYGNATVEISMSWRAIDKDTGRPIYHKVFYLKGKPLPCYVEIPNIGIVRWLTSEDEDHTNRMVGGAGQGSGFVVSPNGFIMTNKHVAAGWRINYLAYSGDYETGKGLLFTLNDKKARARLVDLADSPDGIKALKSWVPADGAVIFDSRLPIAIAASKNQITGENLDLTVRFPGNPGAIQAKLISSSEDADAAEIKIDTQQTLATVEMAQDDAVRVGEHVVVLGFPGFSTETHALRTSVEGGEIYKYNDTVPEPTVSEGLISLLSPPPKQVGAMTVVGEMGDAYQLSVPTSHGNSGGPVFDMNGKVIALFTYGDPQRETHTFAVPIRYARELMQMQRSSD